MLDVNGLFPVNYEQSRDRFKSEFSMVKRFWPEASLSTHAVHGDESTTIDWMVAPPTHDYRHLLICTTGQHGIEGYVGSGMLQILLEEFVPQINPHENGLLLVHAINPWGMKHKRRTNSNNVDLNRNFFWMSPGGSSEASWNRDINPDYVRLEGFLNPVRPLGKLGWSKFLFGLRFFYTVVSKGPTALRNASLLGQYRSRQGVYFGGDGRQEEVQVMTDLYQTCIKPYDRILHLDMHTGFGLQYQMGVVNSPLEPRESSDLEEAFDYPRVLKANPGETYTINGDMIDYMYDMVKNKYPKKHLYATSFEFGTIGLSLAASVKSLRTMVWENQIYWNGAKNSSDKTQASRDFQEMFFPSEDQWRAEAVADARRAFTGILRAEGLIPSGDRQV